MHTKVRDALCIYDHFMWNRDRVLNTEGMEAVVYNVFFMNMSLLSFAGTETRTPLDTPLSRLGVLDNLHMVGPYPPTPPQSYAHMLGSVRTVDHQPTDLSVYSSGHMRDIKVRMY